MDIDSKRVRSDLNEDRLSGLPDELIHKILYCFDTKFAVQTCVLSSRWKLIWKSIPRLEFYSQQFKTLPKFAKFVTHVLTHRNRQVEVSSVKLRFHGVASQVFVRKIANYAFSHNVQELTVISWPKDHQKYPPCLFSSQTLKHLSLKSHFLAPCITPKTPWDFPALTTLHLYDTMLCDNDNESVDLFSKCLNLESLVIEFSNFRAKVFDINTPRLSTLKLINCRDSGVINVIAPLLENLTVINSSINNIKAPLRLSYLRYSDYSHPHPQWFKNCFHSLNEVSVSLSIYEKKQPYKETAARETINMLQELRSARCLTFNMDIVECISSFPGLLSHLPSPFSNLISLNINSDMRSDAYKVELPTEARNFLLENSPSATFIMDLPEPPPTKAMKAKEARAKKAKLLADIHNHMKELQTSLEQGNMLFIERELALEKKKTIIENHMTVLQLWTEKKLMQTERDSAQTEVVVAGLKAQIAACLVEILDMISQDIDEAFTFSSKRAHIKSLLEALPKRQMTEMKVRYTHQLKEIETLCNSLCSARRDLFFYVEEKIEALKEYNSDKISAIHDVSPPPTKAMEAIEARENMNDKLVADIESHMKELQASVQERNINLVERKQVTGKTEATLEDHVEELKVLSDTMRSKPEKVKSSEVEGLIAHIKVHLREMHDLAKQYYEAARAILKKTCCIELWLEKLPNLQSKEMIA
ncbi:F-box domain, cyclin-like protein [Artemisia annua]|uniref:F-box domain, cyclin-like protein n=1 Tax=Artemisia annua TaxID=35608 RepID=A0A2U1N5W0_ARTAN|nr:F-box domain, cyclin-like protein [Artemisia annua]